MHAPKVKNLLIYFMGNVCLGNNSTKSELDKKVISLGMELDNTKYEIRKLRDCIESMYKKNSETVTAPQPYFYSGYRSYPCTYPKIHDKKRGFYLDAKGAK